MYLGTKANVNSDPQVLAQLGVAGVHQLQGMSLLIDDGHQQRHEHPGLNPGDQPVVEADDDLAAAHRELNGGSDGDV